MTYFEGDLQRQSQFGVFQRMVQQFFDATQPVEERIAVQVHSASGLAEIAVVEKEVFERSNCIDAASSIGIEQRAERLFVKSRQFIAVSYTHLRAHETRHDLVCRLLL